MQLLLTWTKTKDFLLFDVINQDITSWFVETSSSLGNLYGPGDQLIDFIMKRNNTEQLIKQESDFIDAVNEILEKLKVTAIEKPTNWFDQSQLNRLHKNWAKTRTDMPKLSDLLYKLDKKYYEAYQEMNCHIHLIEESFKYDFRDRNNWRVNNPFKDKFFPWAVSHLYLKYPGHGRYALEKFKNLDEEQDWQEDNVNWDNIDAFLGMELTRPYEIEPPKEFLSWCKNKQLIPHTQTIPLANLTNWRDNLNQARQTATKNVIINDNYFSLEIV